MISESDLKLIDEYSKNLDMQDIGLFWQLTIKTIDDLKVVSNENLTLEMYVSQLIHLKNIEQDQNIETKISLKSDFKKKEEIKTSHDTEKETSTPVTSQLKSVDQIKEKIIKKPEVKNNTRPSFNITNFQDLIDLASREKELELKYDLERNVKLVSFTRGKIDISFNEKLNKNFIKLLTEKLLVWTHERWIISLSKNDSAKTVYEKNLEKKSAIILKEKDSELAKKFMSAFPDAELVDVKDEDA